MFFFYTFYSGRCYLFLSVVVQQTLKESIATASVEYIVKVESAQLSSKIPDAPRRAVSFRNGCSGGSPLKRQRQQRRVRRSLWSVCTCVGWMEETEGD